MQGTPHLTGRQARVAAIFAETRQLRAAQRAAATPILDGLRTSDRRQTSRAILAEARQLRAAYIARKKAERRAA